MKTGIALLFLLLVGTEGRAVPIDLSQDNAAWAALGVLTGQSSGLQSIPNPYELFPRQIIDFQWENNAWNENARTVATRNGQGKVTQIDFDLYDAGTGSWLPQSRATLTYSRNAGPDQILFEFLFEESWQPSLRISFTYDAQGQVIEDVAETYIPGAGPSTAQLTWQPTNRTVYTYNGSGQLATETSSSWQFLTSNWDNTDRTSYTYAGSNLTQTLDEIWNGLSWQQHTRTAYTYAGSLETEALTQVYLAPNWVNQGRTLTSYNGTNATEQLYQLFFGSTWSDDSRDLFSLYDAQGRPGELISQRFSSNGWENDTRALYEYDSPTSVDDDGLSVLPDGFALLQNYPNPFNPNTTISLSVPVRSTITVTVHDVLGRTVQTLLSGVVPAGELELTWDGRSSSGAPVASGVYFYRVTAPGGVLSRKMLLVK